MTTRSNRSPAGYEWLTRGIRVGFAHPRPIYVSAALMLVVSMLPALFTLPYQLHLSAAGTPPSLTTLGVLEACSIVVSLLLVPINAGFLQVIDAAERGLPARARDIFNPYRNGEAGRLIGFGVAYMLIMIVVMALVVGIMMAAFGSDIVHWYGEVLQAQASRAPPPPLPGGFGIGMTLTMLAFIPLMGFYAIGFGQVALNRRPVFGALRDGVAGAFGNLLPLFVLALCTALVFAIAMIAFVVVFMLLILLVVGLAKLVGTWLLVLLVLLIPVAIAALLLEIAVIYGILYHTWRDVCGDDTTPPPVPTTAIAA